MTTYFQPGFGAFGSGPASAVAGAAGAIPSFSNPTGAGVDWFVQYIMAPSKPVRLRSLMIQALNVLSGGTPTGSVTASYFIAVGPINNAAQIQASQPVPAALFTANPTWPFIPNFQQFAQFQYVCKESGVASANPWVPRTFSDREIVAGQNSQLVVAVSTPVSLAGAPAIITNAPVFMNVLGYDEAFDEFLLRNDPSLGKWPSQR